MELSNLNNWVATAKLSLNVAETILWFPLSIQYQMFLLFIVYLGFNVAFNPVQVISRRVVRRAEETST